MPDPPEHMFVAWQFNCVIPHPSDMCLHVVKSSSHFNPFPHLEYVGIGIDSHIDFYCFFCCCFSLLHQKGVKKITESRS